MGSKDTRTGWEGSRATPRPSGPEWRPAKGRTVAQRRAERIASHAGARPAGAAPKNAAPIRKLLSQLLVLVCLGFAISSCSVTKYLPDGKYLYRGAEVEIVAADSVNTDEITADATATLDNNTNAYLLGNPWKVWFYYRYQTPKQKGLKHWLSTSVGEKPIFFDEGKVDYSEDLLENRAAINGYFYNEASSTTDTIQKKRTITVDYALKVGPRYTIDSLFYEISDSSVARVVEEVRPRTLLMPDKHYDLDLIKAETARLQQALRNRGYYYAAQSDFEFLADTVSGVNRVQLLMKLKDDVPTNHLYPQRIVDVNVHPNIVVGDTLLRATLDTIRYRDINIICADCPLRPKVVDEAFAIDPGDAYSPENHGKTLRRLSGYNMFRYISMSYDPVPDSADSLLVLNAYLQPQLRRRFEGEFGLTYNNARYFGPEVGVGYTNRNLLRGAELLRIDGRATLAFFLGDRASSRVPTSQTYSLTAKLNVPRLWLPARRKLIPRVITSGSVIEVGVNLENVDLNLNQFQTEISELDLMDLANILESDSSANENVSLLQFRYQFGYTWQRRVTKSHEFFPLSFRFQLPRVSTDELLELARGLGVAQGQQSLGRFDQMILYSPNYTLNFDSRLRRQSTHSFAVIQYLSMNFNRVSAAGTGLENQDAELSIYPQVETDFRYYFRLSRNQTVAARVHGGVAYALTDRAIVPYFNLYSVGGPNSLRGFAPRQVGPAATVPKGNNLLTQGGFGNIVFETSLEFRQKLNSLIEVAVFTDAGNVWTYKSTLEPIETDFRSKTFIEQLAVDAGIGLRLDFEFLIFRLDLATPLVFPFEDAQQALPPEERENVKMGQIVPQIAFGYPF